MTKTYTAFSRDIAPDLNKKVPDKVTLKGKVTLSVQLSIADTGYKKVTSSPVWLQKANNEANKIVPRAIDAIVQNIEKAKTVDERSVAAIVQEIGEEAAKKLGMAIKAALAAWIADKSEYNLYKVETAGMIAIGAIGVTSSAASIALTAGAASPVAIISLTRSGMGLAQEIGKAAMAAEKVERLIRADVAVLSKAFAKNKDNKAAQNMKEIGLAGIATILGVDTPTIKNFGDRVELYHAKVTGLKKEHEKFASSLYKMMDLQSTLQKKVKDAAKSDKGLEKAQKNLGKAERSLDEVLKKVVTIGERIETGEESHGKYAKLLAALKNGVSDWTKNAQLVMSIGISVGTSITGVITLIEKDFSVVEEMLKTAAHEMA